MSTATRKRPLRRRILGSSLVDALVGPHGVDSYLELVRPTWTVRDQRARVTAVERQTPDSITLTLRPNAAWEGHRAGQFVNVGVEIDGVRRTRCYSPASAAGTRSMLELTVKRHPEGLVSNHLYDNAREGLFVELSDAAGDFHLPDPLPPRILLISGGSGITPVMSMLRTLFEQDYQGELIFLHYAPDPRNALYADELQRIGAAHSNVRVVNAFTRISSNDFRDRTAVLHGHFSADHLQTVAPDPGSFETFACGPPGLLDAVRDTWAERGLEQRLHVESFVPPSLVATSGVADGRIHFADSDLQVDNNGASLLEQAEAAGLQPEHGCRMGICHSCSCRKTAGTVRNVRTGELSGSDQEEIQLCISAPVGDVALEL